MTSETNIIDPGRTGFMSFIREIRKDAKSTSKLTKRDEKFALMAELDGWKEFKEMVGKDIENLMSLRDYEAAGKDLSELGLRFLVVDLVSERVNKYIRKVENAK